MVQTPGLTPNAPPSPLLPPGVLRKLLGLLAVLGLVLGGGFYWQLRQQALEQRLLRTFQATPTLAVYRLNPQVRWGRVRLSGTVPSPSLKAQAEQIAQQALPRHRLESKIEIPTVPPPPEVIQDNAQQAAATLSQTLNLELATTYNSAQQQLVVQTPDLSATQLQQVTQVMEQITGVRSLVIKVASNRHPLEQRIYFETNETQIASSDRQGALLQLAQYLKANPNITLNVIGHTDQSGGERYNQQLARQRATVIQQLLVAQGIAANRLFIRGDTNLPPNVLVNDPMNKSRCVRFEVVNLEE
ncbi:MAG: OmpA family protein [Spirulina sp. SIO3F2]|nr:OmpA family protein [Spirulina sp. SIO3F2]